MAMIDCIECESRVSDSALKCPSCGVQLKKLKRGFFGKLLKWSFILFNIFMVFSLYTGINSASETMESMSGAEHTGAAIGTGLAVSALFGIWVIGDIILAIPVFLTRAKG